MRHGVFSNSISQFVPKISRRGPGRNVYLSFDDGPDANVTPLFLDLLKSESVQATFFLVGSKVERNRDIVRKIVADGHTLGNHSHEHFSLLGSPLERIIEQLTRTDQVIEQATGHKPRYFRPPYGRFGFNLLRVLRRTQHEMMLWSASPRDYRGGASKATIAKRLTKTTRPGDVVLLHDGHRNSPQTLEALEESLPVLKDRGLRFSALPERSHRQC